METIGGGNTVHTRRVAFGGELFFLVAIRFPVLIWLALLAAVRELLLRAVKKVANAALFLLASIWLPVLIWTCFLVGVHKSLPEVMKKVTYAGLFLLVGVFMPVLIWVAFAVVAYELWLRWRESRFPYTLVAVNAPPRFVQADGRYVPQY